MTKRALAVAALTLGLAGLAAAGPDDHHKPVIKPNAAWEKLKGLVGDWEGKNKERITYKLVSAGTALVETIHMPGDEMVSVYSPDADRVVMTHYCATGNQPRMGAPAGKGRLKKLTFAYIDATNLEGNDAHVMNGLSMTFKGPDTLVHEWASKTKAGKTETTVFELTRKR